VPRAEVERSRSKAASASTRTTPQAADLRRRSQSLARVRGERCKWYDEPDIEAAARDLVDDAIEVASHFPVGAVLRMMYHRDRQQWHYTDDDRWLYIDDDDDDES
jgi:hypothetical protein